MKYPKPVVSFLKIQLYEALLEQVNTNSETSILSQLVLEPEIQNHIKSKEPISESLKWD